MRFSRCASRALGLCALAAACGGSGSRPADDHNAASDVLTTVAPGVISTSRRNETFPAVDPLMNDLWFSAYDDDFDEQTIMISRWNGNGWSTPQVAPFSGQWGDRAPRFDAEGAAIYFTSSRPLVSGADSEDQNIWRVRRIGESWGEPESLAAPVNSRANDMHVAVTAQSLWFASRREGSLGNSDIFQASLSDLVAPPQHLPAPINDERSQPDLWVSRDDAWMILVITDHPSGYGGDDLFVSRWDGRAWSAPVNLGQDVNSPAYEFGPNVSPDGHHLYWTSGRNGNQDIYRIPLAAVPALAR